MRRLSTVLIAVLLLTLIGYIGFLSTQKGSIFFQPVEQYKLVSPLEKVTPAELDNTIQPFLGESFWRLSIDTLQAKLTQLDWVYSARVQKQWPGLLVISVVEQSPVARWGQQGLINKFGEVFFPRSLDNANNLVSLKGRLQDSATVLDDLVFFQNTFDALGWQVKALHWKANKTWHLEFVNGMTLVLDQLDYQSKVTRFVQAYPELDETLRNSAKGFDLRYSNGFIVSKASE